MASTLFRVCARSSLSMCRRLSKPQHIRTYAEAAAAAQPGQMTFTFASPEEGFYQSSLDVKQIDVPTGTGYIGILSNHVPTFGVLKPGVMTVIENSGTANKYFVSSGTYTVNEDASVQVAAEEAVPLDHLDKDAARTHLSKAQAEMSAATTEFAKAEAQVAIQCYEAIIAA